MSKVLNSSTSESFSAKDAAPNSTALCATAIKHCLSQSSLDLLAAVHLHQEIDSTNSFLLTQSVLEQRATVCVAEAQTAGRGRRGNTWMSTPNKNIILSLSWGFANWPKAITGLSLAVGLATAEAINDDFDLNLTIKWPNDLMHQQKKIGGVLVDMVGNANHHCKVVIGLGLNVQQSAPQDYPQDYQFQDLHGLGVYPDRNKLIASIVDRWLLMLLEFGDLGFSAMATRWNKLSNYTGQQIRVIGRTNTLIGQMLGVNDAGGLLLQDSNGTIHIIDDANVSVRLVQ